jgi:hypothetical protein
MGFDRGRRRAPLAAIAYCLKPYRADANRSGLSGRGVSADTLDHCPDAV